MHLQSCCFVNLHLLFFAVLVDVSVVVAEAPQFLSNTANRHLHQNRFQ